MARKRSIVVVRTPQQALAYTQAQAAQRKKNTLAKNTAGPPGALEQLAAGRKKALPLTTPAQAVFPGSGKVGPRKTVAGPRPSKTGYVGSGSPHPAVGTGPVRAPHPSQHGAPKAVVSGAGQTHHTVPADRKSRPPYGNPAGAKVTTPVVTRTKTTTRPKPAANPTRSFPDTSIPQPTGDATTTSTDPFAGLTPQQIVEQMLAPQYAPLDAQTRQENTLYTNQQGTIGDIAPLLQSTSVSQGPGSIPAAFVAALSNQARGESNYQHSQNLQKIADQRQQIAAQAPKLMYDLYTARTQSQLDSAKFALQQAQAQDTALYHASIASTRDRAANALINATNKKFGLEGKKFGLDVIKTKAQIATAQDKSAYQWANLGEKQRQNKVNTWLSKGRNKIALARAGVATDAEKRKWAELQLKYQHGGLTPSARSSYQKVAGQIAKDAWAGKDTVQTDPATGKPVHGTVHQSYQEAMSEMLAKGVPLVLAQRALNTYWSKPGEYNPAFEKPGEGRPKLSFQERQAINRSSTPKRKKKRG